VPLAGAGEDLGAALDGLAQATGAAAQAPAFLTERVETPAPGGAISPDSIAAALAHAIPEGAVVVDESITTGRAFFAATKGAAPHDWLNNCGGSIGYGLPVAIGAAIARPDRKVLALIGDGSAMYTPQALWSMAREGLDITVVIFANRLYRILMGELAGVGVENPGPRALDMLSLDNPALDWVALARGMGVPGERVEDAGALSAALVAGMAGDGPSLIEVAM
jgi:acetolactate synthase I/II/III large subunit